jgi:hypothetical protein
MKFTDVYSEITQCRPQADALTERDVGKPLHGDGRGVVRPEQIGCLVRRRGGVLEVETPAARERRRRLRLRFAS